MANRNQAAIEAANEAANAATTEQNNEANDAVATESADARVRTVKIHGIEFPANRVNEGKFRVKAVTYYPPELEEGQEAADVAGVFRLQLATPSWGISHEDTGDVFTENSFFASVSEWQFFAVLQTHSVFKNIVSAIKANPDAYKFAFADVIVKLTQIYVPADTPFISPFSTRSEPTAKVYDDDKVMNFITALYLDPANNDHYTILAEVKETVYEKVPARRYVRALIADNVFGKDLTEEEVADLIEDLKG